MMSDASCGLPRDYVPTRPRYLNVDRIVLAKGSLDTEERRGFVENICALYSDADRYECLGTPHNRISHAEIDGIGNRISHRDGKRTLVFGEMKTALRFSDEEGNTCPNYWHFSVYGYCFYECSYCYLAGTRGVWHSPTIKIYVNLPEIIQAVDRAANQLAKPTAFYHGKLQDGLALDPLTSFSSVLIPFFRDHAFARQVLLTKSAQVDRLLELDHGGHTILSWSLNPPEIAERFEANLPSIDTRMEAMRRCAEHGYPVRAVIMPIIPVDGWESIYSEFIARLLSEAPIQRLTLGGICIYKNARSQMESHLGRDNAISRNIASSAACGDGRDRYSEYLRVAVYSRLIRAARGVRPDVDMALCLEEQPVWEAVGLEFNQGKCNCVL